jgi:co-chaperonin GroES (HSP10)
VSKEKKVAIVPLGFRVLLKPDEVERTSKGGIVLAVDENKERIAQEYGVVVAVGPLAWKSYDKTSGKWIGEPWVKAGDKVIYSRYGGKFIKEQGSEEWYVVINDEDILAKV